MACIGLTHIIIVTHHDVADPASLLASSSLKLAVEETCAHVLVINGHLHTEVGVAQFDHDYEFGGKSRTSECHWINAGTLARTSLPEASFTPLFWPIVATKDGFTYESIPLAVRPSRETFIQAPSIDPVDSQLSLDEFLKQLALTPTVSFNTDAELDAIALRQQTSPRALSVARTILSETA